MRPKALLPQTRRHVHIYDDDWAWIQSATDDNGLRPSKFVRVAVHAVVKRMQAIEFKLRDQGADALTAGEAQMRETFGPDQGDQDD